MYLMLILMTILIITVPGGEISSNQREYSSTSFLVVAITVIHTFSHGFLANASSKKFL